MDEQLLRQTVANNLLYYRKRAQLTQLELAEKINYSDKSISKWERAEAVPDIYILYKLAKYYNISISCFLDDSAKKVRPLNARGDIISFFSAVIVWLVAVVCFVALKLFAPHFNFSWLAFIYAIPISAIVLFIFNKLWKRHLISVILSSVIIWGIILSLYLSLFLVNIWLIFTIGIPLQIMVILMFFIRR